MQKLKKQETVKMLYIYTNFKKSVWTGMLGSKKTICLEKRGCIVALM